MRLDVDVVVEVAQHRGVLRHVQREVAHVAERVLAEELVLHQQLLRRRLLLRRAGEVPVPEQRHLLLQRRGRRDHAVQPPLLHRDQVLAARAVVLHLERFARVDGPAVGRHARHQAAVQAARRDRRILERRTRRQRSGAGEVDERIDRVARGHRRDAVDVGRRAAEAGAAQQVRGQAAVPRPGVRLQRGRRVERAGGTI